MLPLNCRTQLSAIADGPRWAACHSQHGLDESSTQCDKLATVKLSFLC